MLMLFKEADMLLMPGATPVATPAALMVATVVSLDDQATSAEMFPLVPSAKLPVAVKVVELPWVTDVVRGEIVMPLS